MEKLILGDCLDKMKDIADNSIDLTEYFKIAEKRMNDAIIEKESKFF